jgi:hypothetical protein
MTWNTGTNKFDVPAPYTDTNTRTVLNNSACTNMTWNTGTNKFDVAAPYVLPTAGTGSGGTLGGVKVDGSSMMMMILLLLFLQKQSLAFAVYLFGIGTLHTGPGLKKKTHVIMLSP